MLTCFNNQKGPLVQHLYSSSVSMLHFTACLFKATLWKSPSLLQLVSSYTPEQAVPPCVVTVALPVFSQPWPSWVFCRVQCCDITTTKSWWLIKRHSVWREHWLCSFLHGFILSQFSYSIRTCFMILLSWYSAPYLFCVWIWLMVGSYILHP